MDDDPADWPCLDDRVTAYMAEHPECDLDDAIEALIWGTEEDNENK
jgi:hypothetical protein